RDRRFAAAVSTRAERRAPAARRTAANATEFSEASVQWTFLAERGRRKRLWPTPSTSRSSNRRGLIKHGLPLATALHPDGRVDRCPRCAGGTGTSDLVGDDGAVGRKFRHMKIRQSE